MDEVKDLAVKETEGGFTQDDVLEYLRLLDRRCFIVMHSGISWKPEYAQELEEIDKRFVVLRVRLDAAHAVRDARRARHDKI